jgi:hypothetical protein
MRVSTRIAIAAVTLIVLSAASSADRLREPQQTPEGGLAIDPLAAAPSLANTPPPSAIMLDSQNVDGILGKEVRSGADENMGRIIDVVVDRMAQPRAAVIDFGGFLGVGSRKIAVDWNLLHFDVAGDTRSRITIELTPDQVRAAPDYRPSKPVVITSGMVNLQTNSATPD